MAEKDKKTNLAWIFFIIIFVIAVVWFVNDLMDLEDKAGKNIKVSDNIYTIRSL